MCSARFVTVESVDRHHFGYHEEVLKTQCLLKFLIEIVGIAYDAQIGIEFLTHFFYLFKSLYETLECTSHTYEIPHHMSETLVDLVRRLGALDVHELLYALAHSLLSFVKLLGVGSEVRHLDLIAEIILHGVRYHEVTVGKTLHESRCAKTVGSMVREVTFADSEKTLNRCLELVVNPDTTHCIVACREDHHRGVVGIVIRNHLVHIEKVAVTVTYHILAKTLDSILEVKVNSISGTYTVAGVATLLGCTAGDVTRAEVAERRITTLQIEVAVLIGYIGRLLLACTDSLGVLFLFGHPDTRS